MTTTTPTHQELYERARARHLTDTRFHARVHATAQLLKVSPSDLRLVMHAADLATELLDLQRSLDAALELHKDVPRVSIATSLLVRAVQPSMLDEARDLAEAFRSATSAGARR